MRLVMFDIDGTLTDTCHADDVCYVEALREAFGFENINKDWASYKHTSDSGILGQLFEERCSRSLTEEDGAHFQSCFVKLLDESHQRHPEWYREIPGAREMIASLLHKGYAVSLATGACKPSACFKLEKGGLSSFALPAAYSNDAAPRTEIMKHSLRRALKHYRQEAFEAVTYIGDGVWDARASKALGYGFIGIGQGDRAERLRKEGAMHIFPDYRERSFIEALENYPLRSTSDAVAV